MIILVKMCIDKEKLGCMENNKVKIYFIFQLPIN